MHKVAFLASALLAASLFFAVAEGKPTSHVGLGVNASLWKLPPAFTSGVTTFVTRDGSIYSGRLTMLFQNQTEREGGYSFDDLSGNYHIGNATLDRYYEVSSSGPLSYECSPNMTYAFLHPEMLCGSDNPNAKVVNQGYQYLAVSFRPVPNPPMAWGLLYSCVTNKRGSIFYFVNPNTGYPYFLSASGLGFVNGERFLKISFEEVSLLDKNSMYPNFNAPCESI